MTTSVDAEAVEAPAEPVPPERPRLLERLGFPASVAPFKESLFVCLLVASCLASAVFWLHPDEPKVATAPGTRLALPDRHAVSVAHPASSVQRAIIGGCCG